MAKGTTSGKRNLKITGTREKVLPLFADYFCLRIKDAATLLGLDPENRADCRNLQDIFKRLMARGILTRLPKDLKYYRWSAPAYVYGFTDKGARQFGGKTFDEHSERTLDHELKITEFHIALTHAFQQPRFRIKWHQSNIKHGVSPDAHFSITDTSLPSEKNTANYFLEIERAKYGNIKNGEPSIVRKLAAYFDYYDSNECAKQWGFRKFRVITVVRTADKQYNLCERLSTQYPHRMFWITTEPHVEEGIGGEIFRTPKDWTKVGYSFTAQ